MRHGALGRQTLPLPKSPTHPNLPQLLFRDATWCGQLWASSPSCVPPPQVSGHPSPAHHQGKMRSRKVLGSVGAAATKCWSPKTPRGGGIVLGAGAPSPAEASPTPRAVPAPPQPPLCSSPHNLTASPALKHKKCCCYVSATRAVILGTGLTQLLEHQKGITRGEEPRGAPHAARFGTARYRQPCARCFLPPRVLVDAGAVREGAQPPGSHRAAFNRALCSFPQLSSQRTQLCTAPFPPALPPAPCGAASPSASSGRRLRVRSACVLLRSAQFSPPPQHHPHVGGLCPKPCTAGACWAPGPWCPAVTPLPSPGSSRVHFSSRVPPGQHFWAFDLLVKDDLFSCRVTPAGAGAQLPVPLCCWCCSLVPIRWGSGRGPGGEDPPGSPPGSVLGVRWALRCPLCSAFVRVRSLRPPRMLLLALTTASRGAAPPAPRS